MTSSKSDKEDQVRKSILWSVARITEDECSKVGAAMSRETVAVLSQFVYHFAKHCLAPDMEQFTRHRLQTTRKNASVEITPADILLAARKSPSTVQHLIDFQKQRKKRSKRTEEKKDVLIDEDDDDDDLDVFQVLEEGDDEDDFINDEDDDEEEQPKKKKKLKLNKRKKN
jgi:hypothetical protein